MTLIDKIKDAILENRMPPIFSSNDVKRCGITDLNDNLSNYDKKNKGSKNKKVLISARIKDIIYYSFDEKLFD